MSVKSAIIVGRNIERPAPEWSPPSFTLGQERYITRFLLHPVAPLRVTRVNPRDIDVSDFWDTKTDALYILEADKRYAVAQLRVDSLSKLINEDHDVDGYQIAYRWDDLLLSIDGLEHKTLNDRELHVPLYESKYASVLYIEPEEPLWGLESFDQAAEFALTLIKQDKTTVQPQLFNDFLVCGYGHSLKKSLIFVLLNPLKCYFPAHLEPYQSHLYIPDPVFSLLEYFEYVSQLNALRVSLDSLPFWKFKVSDYLGKLNQEKPLLNTYLDQFLRDRESVETTCVDVGESLQKLQRGYKSNFVLVNANSEFSYINTKSLGVADAFKTPVLKTLKTRHKEAESGVNRRIRTIEKRTQMLSDHLRDSVAAATANSNLLLQRRLKVLSTIAISIGLAALLIGLVPDIHKSTILAKLLEFAGEYDPPR